MKSSGAIKLASKSGCVIPAQHVQMAQPVKAKTEAGHAAPTHGHEPRINLIKDGDRVRAIEVTCTCGEVIRLDCVY